MKTILLAWALALTGLELWAQPAPTPKTPPANYRPPRYSSTNSVTTPPRYQPNAAGTSAAPGSATPRGTTPATRAGGPATGAPGAANAPGAFGQPGATAPTGPGGAVSAAMAQPAEEIVPPGEINFEGVDLSQVLEIYAKYVGRTLLRAQLPQAQIILKTVTPLTRTEVIQALQAVLALNGVSLVNVGDKFVKVVPSADAGSSGGEIDTNSAASIPALGSYITHVVQLKYVKPSEMAPIIQPFGKLKDIVTLDGNGILVIRDYAENVKRMLEMIDKVDVSVPAEYISEVIPIRYAKVDDIASALNALGGGGGGATVSIGTAPGSAPISGLANRSSMQGGGGMGGMGGMSGVGGVGGMGGMGGVGGVGGSSFGGAYQGGGSFGARNPNGQPSSTGQTFQQRLQNIISATGGGGRTGAAGQQQEIQLFGQTKIIPNESSSSLLIYATRADMDVIKGIIAKLDVPLAQVLVEAVIIDVTLGNTFNLGVSAAQNPTSLSPGGSVLGAGGMNNSSSGNPFIDFVRTVTANKGTNGLVNSISTVVSTVGSAGTNAGFGNNLPGGASYFANIGPLWDVAVTAAETDSHASIIQRPRIQTSQAKPAQFFVGDTVPYVTSSYGGYGGYAGNSYSQLSVGVELDVTPFINPEGMVSMDIQQEIDDLNGYTAITGVGNVPNTIKRTLNASITVRDRDTVMLGGFIKSDKSTSKSGVPFLQNIPILGNLFTSRSDSKDRQELIVLMRPTVLQTPELAAKHTINEEQRLPAVSQAAAEDASYERRLIDAQRRLEQKKYRQTQQYDGFFVPPPEDLATNKAAGPTNSELPGTGTNSPAQTDAAQERVNPIPQAVHPQANLVPLPAAPGTSTSPAAAGTPAALSPQDSAAAQQKAAAAAVAQKMLELNSPSKPPPQ